MIFPQMKTYEQERQNRAAVAAQWGRPVTLLEPMDKTELARKHAERRLELEGYSCIPMQDCTVAGVDPTAYEQLVQQGKALLFTLEDGQKLLPLWALLEDGSPNPVAVKVAKKFMSHHGWEGPLEFCRFLDREALMLSADHLYAETGNQDILSHEFKPRLYQQFSRKVSPKGLTRTLLDAIPLAVGKNQDYVEGAIDGLMDHLFEKHHKDDSLKSVLHHLPKPGQPFPKPQA